MIARRAAFLDKDGTVIANDPCTVDPAKMRLLPGVAEGLQLLHRAGFLLVIVSNQSGVALGRFDHAALTCVATALARLFARCQAPLAGSYFCPHHPTGIVPAYSGECACRKPKPGLIHRAAGDLSINLAESWLIGDILDDVEAGNTAGCRTVLVDNGGETEWRRNERRTPNFIVPDFITAARSIVRDGASFPGPSPRARQGGKELST